MTYKYNNDDGLVRKLIDEKSETNLAATKTEGGVVKPTRWHNTRGEPMRWYITDRPKKFVTARGVNETKETSNLEILAKMTRAAETVQKGKLESFAKMKKMQKWSKRKDWRNVKNW